MSQHKGKYLEHLGRLWMFSFSPHKIITTGQGGIIVTNNQAIYNQLILLKDHGRPVIELAVMIFITRWDIILNLLIYKQP